MNPALAIGFEISGGIIALLAFSLVSAAVALRGAHREIASIQKTIADALSVASTANQARFTAEANLKSYKDEVAKFLERPIQANVLLTDEQLRTVANATKGDFPEFAFPKKVN